MSGVFSGRLLHVRSLNHLVRDHRFTYVGARLLAESLHPKIIDSWTNEYIVRKAKTKRRQVYWKYSLFKGFGRDKDPDYRKCVIGSPTTQLTEVWLLSRLSKEAEFKRHPCVYSYIWPHEKSTHVFQYFFKGYMARENRIAQAAAEIDRARVVVLDLKAFYPTIDVPVMLGRFKNRIERSNFTQTERESAIQCVEELTSIKNEVGLPIGPPLSHALANVFLEELDRKLSQKYKRRYFRYVDDVAFVVPKGEVESVIRYFGEVAADEGLRVNSDKGDVLTGGEWASRVRARHQGADDSFDQLISDLRQFLAHNPGDFERVRDMFRGEGFTLPFSRLRAVAATSSLRRYFKGLWTRSGGLFGQNLPQPDALLARSRRLRQQYWERLLRSSARIPPLTGTARRWAIQDCRYSLNRSLYLQNPGRRMEILEIIPDCTELRPSTAVLRALVTGDATELIMYPGPTISSFCELWSETTDAQPRFTWTKAPAKWDRDSACVLALCGLCSPPDHWIEQITGESSRVMLRLSAHRRPSGRTFDDFSYIDEMESLFLGPNVDIERLLSQRFDDGEDVVLPTLSLGGEAYMS